MKVKNIWYKGESKNGEPRYGIGHWVESANQYQCPMTKEEQKLTGCHTEFSSKPFGFMTLQRARNLCKSRYGYSKVTY